MEFNGSEQGKSTVRVRELAKICHYIFQVI